MRSQRFKKSSSNDLSSAENDGAFAVALKKLYGRLLRCRLAVLLRDETPQNVGNTNAELIWVHYLNFAPNLFQFFERDFPWRLWRQHWFPSLRKPPHNQTEQ